MLNFEKISQLADIFNDNIYYIERNANPKILFLGYFYSDEPDLEKCVKELV